ncbi:hypothetical protein CEXT_740781 [Caerostris extrusa]|uniref:Uncharacterized protein n=1 Tax=Caerostris extrusa TaxID=172846 RepID=A0AAV4SD68_CAEEX|nr:hypothetical protein CEXT_740781 [Caerostris extrusa]
MMTTKQATNSIPRKQQGHNLDSLFTLFPSPNKWDLAEPRACRVEKRIGILDPRRTKKSNSARLEALSIHKGKKNSKNSTKNGYSRCEEILSFNFSFSPEIPC